MFVIPTQVLTRFNQFSSLKGPFVVAVSGGADSLYLTLLLSQWAQKHKKKIIAITVDHGLRKESHQEAIKVHRQLEKYKIDHVILTWDGPKPKTRIEERAREKRYQLLFDFCKETNAHVLFLAHHQQDQAETFWARLARGSGLDGLCAMGDTTSRQNILIARPLLGLTKKEITQQLTKHHIYWVNDPMNKDTTYERVRWRQAQKQLDSLGLTTDHLSKSIQRLQRAKNALDFYVQDFIQHHVKRSPYGFVAIDEKLFMRAPEEIRVRVVSDLLKTFAQKDKVISLESIENIAINLPKHATLAGCQWVNSHKTIFIAPELKQLQKTNLPERTWIKWGALLVWTNKSFIAEPCAPKPRLANIPYLIQRTFLKLPKGYKTIYIHGEKELEKNVKLDYKDKAPILMIKQSERKDNE
ncbi:MAG: tRNA lysidine(34) synthetase TilS [Alphaproteobacteria bacterium]|nr:tRNA lysidine(34) synthetase TilS [Alphaproteobacteria bacterium]